MRAQDRYDSLIQYYAACYGLDWCMVKRQIEVESGFRPQAVSPAGAVGLMQTLPATFSWAVQEMRAAGILPADYEAWIKSPEDSIHVGCWYDRWLFERYPEVPDERERWRFALAAYNCGRGNVNQALSLARQRCGQPFSFTTWRNAGEPPGPWQKWEFTCQCLSLVTGERARETIAYVSKILGPGC